ncbi:MAG: HD domain protein [Syntrophorhabdus sp. PtaB.Bin006]|nr:MAG: HD domain protein [Syntrophorhabdus sp. PtaB.Bin006]
MGKDTVRTGLNRTESRIFQLAKPYLQVRDNELHAQNAVEFALKLLALYEAERAVVIPAMILHDVGWSRVSEEITREASRPHADRQLARMHEVESVKIGREILEEVGYDGARVAEILAIIDGHDSRAETLSINDRIVKDSDKLTRYAKNFWFWTRQLPMEPEELAGTLEGMIDQWFFLPESKEMARAEVIQRRLEMDDRHDPYSVPK